MYKVAICGDVHWSTYSSIVRRRGKKYSQRLEKLIKSMNWFEKLSKDHGCTQEIFLGDTFDRSDLSAEELTALQDIKWNKIPKHFIVGNHESNINTLEYSSTKFFSALNANIVNKPQKIKVLDDLDFYLIPYITTDKVIDIYKYIDKDTNRKVLFAHQEIAGLNYGKFISKTGFSIDDIMRECEYFFDGHLHNEQIINDKLILVGILSGQNFNEDADKFEHRVYILTIDDDGKLSIESFINPEAINFYKLRIDTEDDLEKFDHLKNNSVLSILCEEHLIKEVNKLIKSHKNIIESRLTTLYNYNYESSDSDNILVDDFVNQFILLAKEKLAPSDILNTELALLGR